MVTNPYLAKFVMFEGIDFSGKSTQFERVKKYISAYRPQLPVKYTKEPNKEKPIGAQVYRILNGQDGEYDINYIAPFHMQAFYIEDRVGNYRDDVLPALSTGVNVLQDRGFPSLAYGSQSPFDFDDFLGLNERMFSVAMVPFVRPDLILIFDAPAEVAVARMKEAGREADAFENLKTLTRARDNYRSFSKGYPNCHLIDGTKGEVEVFKAVMALLAPLLGLSRN